MSIFPVEMTSFMFHSTETLNFHFVKYNMCINEMKTCKQSLT